MFYAATIFLSAFLLFLVQPLLARLILPWFGGTAAVWTTCMLFFQTLLLAGYAYAHAANAKLAPRTQARQAGVFEAPGVVVRWMLNPRLGYELARKYYHPFDTLVDPDAIARAGIAELVRAMAERGRPSLVIVNNKAEGSAPRSIPPLAESIRVALAKAHQNSEPMPS